MSCWIQMSYEQAFLMTSRGAGGTAFATGADDAAGGADDDAAGADDAEEAAEATESGAVLGVGAEVQPAARTSAMMR